MLIGVIGFGVVDDVGDELEGERRVDAIALPLAEAAYPACYAGQEVIFVRQSQNEGIIK